MHIVALFMLVSGGTPFGFSNLAWGAADGDCPSWDDAVALAPTPAELTELSGLVASPTTGVLWAHNDSGGDETLFALDSEGKLLGEVAVRDADNSDWEDIAIGPCDEDGCSCLYVADIGDQDGPRERVVIYRVGEPEDPQNLPRRTETADPLIFSYTDGTHDAEALAIHPITGELLIITKQTSGPAGVYAGQVDGSTLEAVLDLDLLALGAEDGRVTGAAVSPGGLRLAIRTESEIFVWNVGDGTLAEALTSEPILIEAPDDEGEAVTFTADGQALVVAGEGAGGSLWTIPCAVFADEVQIEAAVPCPTEGCGCASGPPAQGKLGLLALTLALVRSRRRRSRRAP